MSLRKKLLSLFVLPLVLLVYLITFLHSCTQTETQKIRSSQIEMAYLGSQSCASCHAEAFKDWQGSQHELAMATPDSTTVIGDFNDRTFTSFGTRFHFFMKDGQYYVNTVGPKGEYQDYPIAYTYGIHPLQQYLIQFPKGKIQCLSVAWDALENKWYSLYPNQKIDPNDWMHWTGGALNWNTMCSDCHSTNVQKNFINEADSFHTTWSLINVSCESCHGPGSAHVQAVEQMESGQYYDANEHLHLTRGLSNVGQVDQCARCHSRRSQITNSYQHGDWFMDHYIPSLITDELYFSDGQILEEDYVYASFIQSKMYQEGVKCTDCHNPHSLELKFPDNQLCLQCHEPSYDLPSHHFHAEELEAATQCINCHMTGRTYMGNDFRRDHSFRVPRPDQSVVHGTPNACNDCHASESAEWAAAKVEEWYGPDRPPHFSDALTRGSSRRLDAIPGLVKLAQNLEEPAIARATAIAYLAEIDLVGAAGTIAQRLNDPDALVRHTAINNLSPLPPQQKQQLLPSLLSDTIRAVRIAAASALADTEVQEASSEPQQAAEDEYLQSLKVRADFPGGQMELGQYYEKKQQWRLAEQSYAKALKYDSLYHPARINLAFLSNRLGKKQKAQRLLIEITEYEPEYGNAWYSLGLLMAEFQKYDSAAFYLSEAARIEPYNSRAYYNWGLILQNQGKANEAESIFKQGLEFSPSSEELNYALAILYYQQQQFSEAKARVRALIEINPGNPNYQQLAQRLNMTP